MKLQVSIRSVIDDRVAYQIVVFTGEAIVVLMSDIKDIQEYMPLHKVFKALSDVPLVPFVYDRIKLINYITQG